MPDKTTRSAKRPKPRKPRVDPFLHHEALDRSYCVADAMCSVLGDHPYINGNAEVLAAYIKAADAVWSLYQLIGKQDAS